MNIFRRKPWGYLGSVLLLRQSTTHKHKRFPRYRQRRTPESPKTLPSAPQNFTDITQGETLQARLIRRSKDRHDSSWIAEWWNKIAYLYDRGPTVFFVSYYYHFSDGPWAVEGRTQTGRAAALLHAALEFRQHVIAGTLPPEKIGRRGTPLCSVAYKYM